MASPLRTAVALTAVAAVTIGRVAAIPMAYCATVNTASTAANSSIYQSDGLCQDFCNASNNAYAIVQDSNCWCSDYTPASSIQVNTNKCSNPCPGFPSDTCGGSGLWGYIQLGASPSGVKGGSGGNDASTQTTETPPTALPDPTTTTLIPVPTPTPKPSPPSPTTDSSTKTSSSRTTQSTKQTSATNTGTTPLTIVSTVTADGSTSQVTITLPPNANNGNQASSGEMSTTSSGLSTGAAVGIAVGVLGVLGIIIGAAVWFWLRRRKQNQQEAAVERSNSGRGSSAGMMGTPRTEMASIWDSEQLSTGRRNSRLMPHDPRMDPFAGNIYAQTNKSRESINTLQDNHDYSRKVLRTTNPDPDQD